MDAIYEFYRIKLAQAGLMMVGIGNGLTIIFMGLYEVRASTRVQAATWIPSAGDADSDATPPSRRPDEWERALPGDDWVTRALETQSRLRPMRLSARSLVPPVVTPAARGVRAGADSL